MEKRLTKSEAKCRKLEAELSKKPSWPKDLKGAMDELGIGSRTTMTAVRNDLDDRFGIWTNEKSVSRYTDVDRDRQIDVQSRLPTRGGRSGKDR